MAEAKSNYESQPESTGRWLLWALLKLSLRFGNAILVALCFIVAALCAKSVLIAYAGRTSIASLAFLGEFNLGLKISLLTTGLTSFMWTREFVRHRKTRKRLTKRVSDLEGQLDPGRSSSELAPDGMTLEEDL